MNVFPVAMAISFSVALDFYGVIADPVVARIQAAKDLYSIDISPHEASKHSFPLGMDKYAAVQARADQIVSSFSLMPGAKGVLEALSAEGFIFNVLTNRTDDDFAKVRNFCANLQLPVETVLSTPSKADKVRSLKPHAYVDDLSMNLTPLRDAPVVLVWFRQAWNQEERAKKNIVQGSNWEEIGNALRAVRKNYQSIIDMRGWKYDEDLPSIYGLWARQNFGAATRQVKQTA